MSDICVIGAGPAGSTIAARLAQLGHVVHIVERARFPRMRLGESLTPGVMPLLAAAGLDEGIEAEAARLHGVRVKWEGDARMRETGHNAGLIVDRGRFDQRLLHNAARFGVQVHQPARVISRTREAGRWALRIESEGRAQGLCVDFLVDARGRRRTGAGGPRTIALHRYWTCASMPETPIVEAGEDAWYWGVPLPGGLYNTIVFVDPVRWRARGDLATDARFRHWLDRSGAMAGCVDARPCGPVQASDATPFVPDDVVGRDFIRVGDAGVAIDAISSSGVQKAIRSALSGAIVVNTLLRRPSHAAAAIGFYDAQLRDAARQHGQWAAGHDAKVAGRNHDSFWTLRAADAAPEPATKPAATVEAMARTAVALSAYVSVRDTPCLDEEFVGTTPALHHPNLTSPVAFLGGFPVAPLLERLPAGSTPLQIARSWENLMPLRAGLAIAGWLVDHGILVQGETPREHS